MSTFVTINPIDPGTDTRVTVRLCASQDPAHTGAASQVWWPAITTEPVIQSRLFDGDFTSGVDAGSATIEVRLDVLRASGLFPRVERYDWAGATATIQRLVAGSLVDLAVMKVESFAAEDMQLGLRLSASEELFDTDVLTATYAGTTGLEGGADLKGRVKPWVFGRALNVEPVFIDQIDNVFQVSGYGPVQAISAVYERGASFGVSIGNFASYAALVAANIPEGRWGTCLAQGLIRLGAPPAGVITCDVDGDNTGGFLRRTGAIINEIANRLGLTASVNATSLAALDTTVPRNVNIVISDQTRFMELVQRMVAPCNAVPGIDRSGRLIVSRVAFGAEQFTLDAQGREMPPVLGMARQNTSAPYKRIQIGAARSWRVHTLDEIAFFADLIDRGLYAAGTVYREGDIVASADKSRWVYINATPSAGNAPPTWPTASNSFWENLEPPLNPAAIGVETGATRNVPRGTYAAGTTYVRGDTVLFSGSSYQLIVDTSTGNAPPDVVRWALLANAGSGPAGADGLPGISVIVNNEAHVVATAADGSGGDYSAAGGQMRLLRGDVVLTPTFSIAAQTPASPAWISINSSTGVYTVSDPGVDLATATIRATWAGVNYDRTYTLAKSKQGVTGPRLALAASAQAFTFTDGAANPGGQSITIEALLNNLSGTASFSTTPTVTLTGTGNTRTLTAANFGSNRQVTVEATLGGITDRITIVRLDRDVVAPANANRLPFSRMEGDRGWVRGSSSPSSSGPVYSTVGGRRAATVSAVATAAEQFVQVASAETGTQMSFPVRGGERLSISARVAASGTLSRWQINFAYRRANGDYLETNVGAGLGTRTLDDPRFETFFTVPADAVSGAFLLFGVSSGAGTYSVAVAEPMVTSAAPGQTVHPNYTPGPNAVDGALPNNLITIDSGILNGIGTGGVNVDNRGVVLSGLLSARPASGAYIGQTYTATDTREFFRWDGFNWQTASDVTLQNQITTSQPAPFQVQANAEGVTTTDLSTQTRSITLFRGGVAQTSGVTVGTPVPSTGITVASAVVSGGIVTVTLATANASGSVTVPVIFAGVTYNVTIPVTRTIAAPVAGGSGPQPFFDQSWSNITSTTYTQVTDAGATVLSTSGGQLAFSYSAQYNGGRAQCKAQYSANGTTWFDVAGSEVTGSIPITTPGEQEPGSISRSQVIQSGLDPATLYHVRLVARRTGGSGVLSWLAPTFTARQP